MSSFPDTQLLRIRASAGSGKTYTLTRLFLDQLRRADLSEYAMEGVAACAPKNAAPRAHGWPEILAVTFTNRAALEMKERVIRTLKSMALGQEPNMPDQWTPDLARRWLEIILRRFGSLNVRTIDSLLHMIVRLSALELGLPPEFEPVFTDEEALAPLLDAMLEESRRDQELRTELSNACHAILLHTPDKGFLLGTRLRDRVFPLIPLMSVCENGPPPLETITARLSVLTSALRQSAREIQRFVEQERLPLSTHAIGALQTCLDCDGSRPLDEGKAMLRKATLDEWLKAAGKGKASADACSAYSALRRAIDNMYEEGNLLCAAMRYLPYARLAWRVSQALAEYLQTQPKLPANLIPGLAHQILQGRYGVSEAFCRMGSNLTHILVDEFQDTSREQWGALHLLALEALSRGGSLTWAGDVKQAIYSWRGGDPRLFDEVMRDPELSTVSAASRTDTLPTNHRSRAAVVRANNSIFSQLGRPDMARSVLEAMLPGNIPPLYVEQASLTVAEAFQDAAQLESGKPGGFVCLEPLRANSAAALREEVAARVTELVREITSRRAPGDVGILVRTNTQANALAGHLLAQGIPVVTENSLLLAEHPLISQCIALLEWLDAPQDDTAFWTLVSGPGLACPLGMAREDLEAWLATREQAADLAHAFQRDFPESWEQWLRPFYTQAGLISPYDAVREMLRCWNVWDRHAEAAPFVQRLLEILHQTEREGCTSMASFLDYWRHNGESEKAPMPDTVDAVRIMTVHKSKGLQFPVVIVPGHDFSGNRAGDPNAPVPANVGEFTVFLPQGPAVGEIYFTAATDSAREALNLLYVAWTRAEEELYAILTETPMQTRKPGLVRALPMVLADLGSPWERHPDGRLTLGQIPADTKSESAAPPFWADHAATDTLRGKETPTETSPSSLAALEPDWRPMGWLPRLKIFRNDPEELFFTARRRGTFTHACLKYLADFVRSLPDALDGAQSAMVRPLIEESVGICRRAFPMPVPDEAVPAIVDNLHWFVSLPQTVRWMRQGSAEQPLLDADGTSFRPDLLVPEYTEDEICSWTVVDYKTGMSAQEYAAQMRGYVNVIARISGLPVRGYLVYMDERRLEAVRPEHCK